MLTDLISRRWLRLTITVTISLLAVVGLWSLLRQVFSSDPCLRGTCPRWITIGNQGLDLCRIVSWQDQPDQRIPEFSSVVVWVQSGRLEQMAFRGNDREILLFHLSCGQAR
jgi:hypothetical protein